MGSVCADEHKLHPCHQLFLAKKSSRKIDIPPRMLLSRLEANFDSSRSGSSEETLLRKFLPYNNPHDDDDDYDPYSAEHFRMYEFKIRKCTRSRSHDRTDCPFVHPGEKARRRDPRRYHYSSTVCPDFRRAGCARGDNCEFSHGVFECCLHPARYRTEACKDGKNCKRKICFFAHTSKQLRILSSEEDYTINSPISKYGKHCCGHCHCVTASPTSTLLGMSDYLSPPISPVKSRLQMGGFSPVSRFSDRQVELNHEVLRYEEALKELIESMRVNDYSSTHGGERNRKVSWVDVSNFDIGDEQQQFVMSPMGPSHSGSGQFVTRKQTSSLGFKDEKGGGAPDLGWVNDLLT